MVNILARYSSVDKKLELHVEVDGAIVHKRMDLADLGPQAQMFVTEVALQTIGEAKSWARHHKEMPCKECRRIGAVFPSVCSDGQPDAVVE